MKFSFPFLLAALLPSSDAQSVTPLHGSGTTNPQKCYWDIMDKLEKQAKLPVRMTYRGVGSGTGQKEFIGLDDESRPYNDFGSGDIPLDEEDYNSFVTAGTEIYHLPIVMGAISFFHSVPTDGKPLNLTPCVLAKILNRDITDWTDPEVIELNPDLSLPSPFEITVARRVKGSSSTASITSYLNFACGAEWGEDLVGKTISWKAETVGCEGSGGMTTCIRDKPGTIGYIDIGHGHAEGLSEIALRNAAGKYLTSLEAKERGGILAAASPSAGIPENLNESFANVNLLNQDGTFTWPIVAMTYIYIRNDITYLEPESQRLLKAFLTALYMPEYNQICADEFGFVPVTGTLKEKAEQVIQGLTVSGVAKDWSFELSTEVGNGQLDHVFSVKRDSYSEIEQDALIKQVAALQAEIEALKKSSGSSTADDAGHTHAEFEDRDMEDEQSQEIMAALVLSSISFVLWVLALIGCIVKYALHI